MSFGITYTISLGLIIMFADMIELIFVRSTIWELTSALPFLLITRIECRLAFSVKSPERARICSKGSCSFSNVISPGLPTSPII